MARPTLPNNQLAEAARVAQRVLDRFERGLLDVTFEGRIPGVNIAAVSDGRGHITSLSVAPALIPLSGGPQAVQLAEWLRQTLQLALAAATDHAHQVLQRKLPSLPGTQGQHPNEISGLAKQFLSDAYTGTSAQGQVSVTISLGQSLVPTAVTIANAFYASAERLSLGERVREAANAALTSARDALECAAAGLAHVLTGAAQ